MKRILAFSFLLVLAAAEVKAQDPEFTQFYANPIYLNPAFAGTAVGPRFCLNSRLQWPSISGAYVTNAVSYDQHFDGLAGGIGGQVWYDRAGDGKLSTTFVSGVYSYHLQVKQSTRDYFVIKAGVQASAFQRFIDFHELHFGDEIDPKWGFVRATAEKGIPASGYLQTKWTPDISAGMIAFTKRFYGGLAVAHIIEPGQSFFGNPLSTLPRKYTMHLGLQIPIDRWKREPETFFSPNLLIQRQAQFTQVNIGGYAIRKFFVAGVWYRHTDPNADAMMLLIGVKKDPVKVGYSYDLTVSDARVAAVGSHEVSLIVELKPPRPNQVRKWRKINCPEF